MWAGPSLDEERRYSVHGKPGNAARPGPRGAPPAGVSSGDTLTAELERAPPARPRTLHTLP